MINIKVLVKVKVVKVKDFGIRLDGCSSSLFRLRMGQPLPQQASHLLDPLACSALLPGSSRFCSSRPCSGVVAAWAAFRCHVKYMTIYILQSCRWRAKNFVLAWIFVLRVFARTFPVGTRKCRAWPWRGGGSGFKLRVQAG